MFKCCNIVCISYFLPLAESTMCGASMNVIRSIRSPKHFPIPLDIQLLHMFISGRVNSCKISLTICCLPWGKLPTIAWRGGSLTFSKSMAMMMTTTKTMMPTMMTTMTTETMPSVKTKTTMMMTTEMMFRRINDDDNNDDDDDDNCR